MSPFCPPSAATSGRCNTTLFARVFSVHSQGPHALSSNEHSFATVSSKENIACGTKFLRAKAGECLVEMVK